MIVNSKIAPAQQKKTHHGPPSDAQKYAGRPIHLSATATVTANATAGINAQALHNPIGGPIEITCIKFAMNANVAGGTGSEILGSGLGVALDLNGIPITNGYVPIWSFDKTVNFVNEQLTGLVVTDYGEFCWYLPRPLWVGPNDQIGATFQNFGMNAAAINARISVSGRVVTTNPRTRYLPYAAAYSSKVFTTVFGAADSDQSTETDLVNVTNDVIYIQRLTGRYYLYASTTNIFIEGPAVQAQGAEDLGCLFLTTQIYTGHGEPVVPYYTTFRNVFCGVNRSWEMGGVPLKPGDYHIVSLSKANDPGSASNIPVYGQATVALSGWREIAI